MLRDLRRERRSVVVFAVLSLLPPARMFRVFRDPSARHGTRTPRRAVRVVQRTLAGSRPLHVAPATPGCRDSLRAPPRHSPPSACRRKHVHGGDPQAHALRGRRTRRQTRGLRGAVPRSGRLGARVTRRTICASTVFPTTVTTVTTTTTTTNFASTSPSSSKGASSTRGPHPSLAYRTPCVVRRPRSQTQDRRVFARRPPS